MKDEKQMRPFVKARLVLPGPRRSRKRRLLWRLLFIVAAVLIAAIGWLGYQELSSTVNESVEFSGP